jgi:hypothetical protein
MKRSSPAMAQSLRKHLAYLLSDGGAHVDFDTAIARLPAAQRGARIAGAPHTAWQLLEHLRIAQWDILEFSRNAGHVSPKFPDGYWPPTDSPPSARAWSESVRTFQKDLRAMIRLVSNPKTDLFAPIPHGDGQTILREALLVADHNAYHIGQLVLLRKLLDAWPRKPGFSI